MRTRKQPPKSEHKLVPRLGNQVAALHKCDKVASCRLYHSHPRQLLYGGLGMSVYAWRGTGVNDRDWTARAAKAVARVLHSNLESPPDININLFPTAGFSVIMPTSRFSAHAFNCRRRSSVMLTGKPHSDLS